MASEPYPYVYYNARWSGYFSFLMGFGFLAAVIYGFANGMTDQFGILFFLLLATLFIWLGYKTVTDDKPALQFGRNGIWTRKLGAVAWEKVVLKYRTVSNPKSGSTESVVILDKSSHQQLDYVSLTSISGSTELIKQRLASCTKAQIL